MCVRGSRSRNERGGWYSMGNGGGEARMIQRRRQKDGREGFEYDGD
jgi:hypothetical protein